MVVRFASLVFTSSVSGHHEVGLTSCMGVSWLAIWYFLAIWSKARRYIFGICEHLTIDFFSLLIKRLAKPNRSDFWYVANPQMPLFYPVGPTSCNIWCVFTDLSNSFPTALITLLTVRNKAIFGDGNNFPSSCFKCDHVMPTHSWLSGGVGTHVPDPV